MGVIRTNAAAAMLGVSPSTLRSWERRFGFPEPDRTAGGHRQFDLGADRGAARRLRGDPQHVLGRVHGPRARRRPVDARRACAPPSGASTRTRPTACWRRASPCAPSSAPSRRSCCPAVEALATSAGAAPAPEYGFAWRWATGWLAAAQRVAPPASRPEGVVVFDASAASTSTRLHAQALELVLRRAGLRTLDAHASGSTPRRLPRASPRSSRAPSSSPAGGASLDALGPPRLRRAPRRRRRGRGLRLPRRAARDGREHRRPPRRRPLAALDALVAHLEDAPPRGAAPVEPRRRRRAAARRRGLQLAAPARPPARPATEPVQLRAAHDRAMTLVPGRSAGAPRAGVAAARRGERAPPARPPTSEREGCRVGLLASSSSSPARAASSSCGPCAAACGPRRPTRRRSSRRSSSAASSSAAGWPTTAARRSSRLTAEGRESRRPAVPRAHRARAATPSRSSTRTRSARSREICRKLAA